MQGYFFRVFFIRPLEKSAPGGACVKGEEEGFSRHLPKKMIF